MGHNPEIGWNVYTPEQASMLGIELPRQPWSSRLHGRVVGTLKRVLGYGLGGGVGGLPGGRVVGEGIVYAHIIFRDSVDEGLVSANIDLLPVYMAFVVGSGLIAARATAFAVLGKDPEDL